MKRDVPVRPVSVEVEDASKRARADDLACANGTLWSERRWNRSWLLAERTNNPAKVDVGGEVRTESDRSKFSGIGDGEGLEDAEAVIARSSVSGQFDQCRQYSIPATVNEENSAKIRGNIRVLGRRTRRKSGRPKASRCSSQIRLRR